MGLARLGRRATATADRVTLWRSTLPELPGQSCQVLPGTHPTSGAGRWRVTPGASSQTAGVGRSQRAAQPLKAGTELEGAKILMTQELTHPQRWPAGCGRGRGCCFDYLDAPMGPLVTPQHAIRPKAPTGDANKRCILQRGRLHAKFMAGRAYAWTACCARQPPVSSSTVAVGAGSRPMLSRRQKSGRPRGAASADGAPRSLLWRVAEHSGPTASMRCAQALQKKSRQEFAAGRCAT